MKTLLLSLAILFCASVVSAQGYGWRGEYGFNASPNPYAYQNYGYGYGYGGYGGYIQQNQIGPNTYYNGYAPGYGRFNAQTYNFGRQRQTYFRYGY